MIRTILQAETCKIELIGYITDSKKGKILVQFSQFEANFKIQNHHEMWQEDFLCLASTLELTVEHLAQNVLIFNKYYRRQLDIHMQMNEVGPLPHHYTQKVTQSGS